MERKELFELLKKVESGQMTAEQGMQDMSLQPDMLVGNYADIDLHYEDKVRQKVPVLENRRADIYEVKRR